MEIQNLHTHHCLFITINSHMFILQHILLPSNSTMIPKHTVTIKTAVYISDSWTVYIRVISLLSFYGIFIAQKFQLYHHYYITIYIQSQV